MCVRSGVDMCLWCGCVRPLTKVLNKELLTNARCVHLCIHLHLSMCGFEVCVRMHMCLHAHFYTKRKINKIENRALNESLKVGVFMGFWLDALIVIHTQISAYCLM